MGLALLTLFLALHLGECITRIYYIGIREENWNYAPLGINVINSKNITEDKHASVFLERGPHRIGSVYKKAVYRQYSDARYKTEVPKPAWLGFLGPVLRAQVDDVIIVHLKNFASRAYSLHPHGVFYEKDSEGALYPDGTSGRDKSDDAVPPNQSHTYTWIVKPEYAPTEADAPCLTWIYHSHVDAPKDISSGLIGALLTCKPGTLRDDLSRSDVDKEFFLMFSVVDENLSWYLQENTLNFCSDPHGVNDKDFEESNKMHSINGYVFGNLPGLDMCVGRSVSWHLVGIGNEVDIHSAHFHGHTLLSSGHRSDTLSLFPATFITAEMVPTTMGKWLLSCQVNDHIQAGMQGFFQVSSCGSDSGPTVTIYAGGERKYFISAEEIVWDYAPQGIDTFNNQPLNRTETDSEMFFGHAGGRLGGQYRKVRYVGYTNNTFSTQIQKHDSDTHLGLLGPVIRAETGDVVVVTFLNRAKRSYSIQPHGLQYDKTYEGAKYQDGSERGGTSVKPGERFTYRWRVAEGPSPSDPACLSYLYYSASDPVHDTNAGLLGPLQVCRRGALDESGRQRGVDKEFFLMFSVLDENLSWYLQENIETYGTNESDQEDPDFQESNKMHAVNGLMYGNLRGLAMCAGEQVAWHMLGLGSETDLHGVYFQGNTFRRDGTTRDTLSIFPHTSVTVAMTPDNHGMFELSCRTADHYVGGMRQHYTVQRCPAHSDPSSKVTAPRDPAAHYFLAAEEVEWDYAPSRSWELEKHNTTEKDSVSPGSVFLEKTADQIGSRYRKVVFREYTDDAFSTQKNRLPEEQHLGILGPILRVQVGESVLVTFKNKATIPYSLHAHGVGTNQADQSAVEPNGVKRYQWNVPERSGPGPSDPNCITFAYYSTVNFLKDLVSGLIGPLLVCRAGVLDTARRRNDVDREFALLFMVFDENESWYLNENIQTYLSTDPLSFTKTDVFEESNMMHGINGKLYGNLHGLEMEQGERTNWYLLGMGNEVDMHTVHFHAQTFIYKTDHSHRADVFDLFPGTFQTVELTAGHPGTWLLHCHVTDHIHAGMETTFTIRKKRDKDETTGNNGGSGMIIGVVIIGVVFLVLIVLFIAVVFRARRKRKRLRGTTETRTYTRGRMEEAANEEPHTA